MNHDPHGNPRLILASESPRRAQLLRDAGYEFEVVAPPLEEPDDRSPNVPPQRHAEALSYFKARSVKTLGHQGLIIAADTIACDGLRTFGKPADREDARRILLRLIGTTHSVITGLTVLDTRNGARLITHDRTEVAMNTISPEQLDRYLDGGQWVGKAGAYGIQDVNDEFVERIDGSFTNVVGLPMALLARLLERCDYAPSAPSA